MEPKNFADYLTQARIDYGKNGLNEEDLQKTPFLQFEKWFSEAILSKIMEPYAMCLSTISEKGRPASRIVLLREFGEKGFIFYTNYHSKKGADLHHTPFAALNFFWPELERQIRIEGSVSQISAEESDKYFATRPRASRLGAWVSNQSEVIPNRDYLNHKIPVFEEKFKDKEVERPDNWGGYIVKPDYFEFWQGRPSRLHDRLVFQLHENSWITKRLSP